MIVVTRSQSLIFLHGVNFVDFVFFIMKIFSTKIEAARAITPPNFEGMERKITYANKKYHSG